MNQCTLVGNHSDNDTSGDGGGGGIYNGNGFLSVSQSTLTGNHADNGSGGGGIYNGSGNLNIFNSIVAGNSASGGSGPGTDIFSTFNFNLNGANIIQDYQGSFNGPAPINPNASLSCNWLRLATTAVLTQTTAAAAGIARHQQCLLQHR